MNIKRVNIEKLLYGGWYISPAINYLLLLVYNSHYLKYIFIYHPQSSFLYKVLFIAVIFRKGNYIIFLKKQNSPSATLSHTEGTQQVHGGWKSSQAFTRIVSWCSNEPPLGRGIFSHFQGAGEALKQTCSTRCPRKTCHSEAQHPNH